MEFAGIRDKGLVAFSFDFINPDTGFISSKGYILKTVNSGSNWEKINIYDG